jgi:hypothetical protein
MKKKQIKSTFPFIAVLLLVPWPIAYARDISWASTERETVQIETAEAFAAPTGIMFQKAIGAVSPGELYYIDATDIIPDIEATLYLTNTQELVHSYAYLILKVGVYVRNSDGEWIKATQSNGEPLPDTFLTLKNGLVSFRLQGCADYMVAIDAGCFRTMSTCIEGGSLSPDFFLEVEYPQYY